MAEKIATHRAQEGSSGALSVTIPRAFVDDAGIKKGDVLEIYRQGTSIIIKPAAKEKGEPDK